MNGMRYVCPEAEWGSAKSRIAPGKRKINDIARHVMSHRPALKDLKFRITTVRLVDDKISGGPAYEITVVVLP